MTWDPDISLKFRGERTRPAIELLARVPIAAPGRVIDLGCGPGNSTALLAACARPIRAARMARHYSRSGVCSPLPDGKLKIAQ
jgi:hypothetical protein